MSRANPLFRSPFYAARSPIPNPSPPPPKRKVVNIPVHFVASIDRSSAAITIQRAFRGFLVRKNMRAVRLIDREVDAIVRRIESEEGIDLILRDERERLKVNEKLMRLLFRLDSVRGVRDYRRKVIRRVISLQEAVDVMSAVRSNDVSDGPVEKPDQIGEEVETLEDGDSIVVHQVEEAVTLEDDDSIEVHQVEEAETLENEDQSTKSNQQIIEQAKVWAKNFVNRLNEKEEAYRMRNASESMVEMSQPEEVKTIVEDLISRAAESSEMPLQTLEDDDPIPEADELMEMHQTDEVVKTLAVEDPISKPDDEATEMHETEEFKTLAIEDPSSKPDDPMQTPQIEEIETLVNDNQSANPSNPMDISADWELVGQEESAMEEEESIEIPKPAIKTEVPGSAIESESGGGVKEVMERMMAGNERLKGLVLELCERSAQQCRLVGGLAERVEQLEKAVQKMERKRKKNKRKDEIHPVDKKCGRDDKQLL